MQMDNRSKGLSIVYIRDVLWVLVARDFKLRYKRSVLGILWSLLVPLAQLVVLQFVFTQLLPLNIPNFTAHLLTGILPWTWFQSSLFASTMTIVSNRDLVKQVGFPVGVLPPVTVLSHLVHFLLALPILGVLLARAGIQPGIALLALPLVIAVQFVFTLSVSYLLATLQVRFNDTQYLLGIFLFLYFYVTPIFWALDRIAEPWRSWAKANPLATLLDAYRDIFMRGQWPAFGSLGAIALPATGVLFLVYLMFMRARTRFVEEL